MLRVGLLLSLICAEICLCPADDQSFSSDYWSSSERIIFCSPEVCDNKLSTTKFSTTTTTVLSTTCVAVPTVEYTSGQVIPDYSDPEVCFNLFS